MSADFELTMEELRVVARFAAECAAEVLPIFERDRPEDSRPRAALEAAWTFANGDRRTRLQRVTAVAAHRAAGQTSNDAAAAAARAAGDAAASAYLHPLAQASQGGHILRAAALAARAVEVEAGGDPSVGDRAIEQASRHAPAVLVEVLHRYPPAPVAKQRVGQLWKALDTLLRSAG